MKVCNVEPLGLFVPVPISIDELAYHSRTRTSTRFCGSSGFFVRRYRYVCVLFLCIIADDVISQKKVHIPSDAKGITEWVATKDGKVSANTFVYQKEGAYTREAWIVVFVALVVIVAIRHQQNQQQKVRVQVQPQHHSPNSDPDPRLWTPRLCAQTAIPIVVPTKIKAEKVEKENVAEKTLENGFVPQKVR